MTYEEIKVMNCLESDNRMAPTNKYNYSSTAYLFVCFGLFLIEEHSGISRNQRLSNIPKMSPEQIVLWTDCRCFGL